MLAPLPDAAGLRTRFAVDDRLRLDDVLTEAAAHGAREAIAALPFDLIFHAGGSGRVAPREEMDRLTEEQRAQLQNELFEQAGRGVGFLYAGYRMEGTRADTAPTVLQELFETINGPLLEQVKTVTGIDTLKSADGQFTRYDPGHFLTRHSDAIGAENRRVAYVLNLTQDWHPDWGGLLQFYEADGTPRDAWAPRFNSLALFDVRHVHAVTFVAPYARSPRLALTGWFRDA